MLAALNLGAQIPVPVVPDLPKQSVLGVAQLAQLARVLAKLTFEPYLFNQVFSKLADQAGEVGQVARRRAVEQTRDRGAARACHRPFG